MLHIRRAAVTAALLAAAIVPVAATAAPLPADVTASTLAPQFTPALAALPAATCTEDTPNHRSCDLWAKNGTTDLPGRPNLPVWGFVTDSAASPATPGGPLLVVNQGDVVAITLHNALPIAERLSLSLPSAPMLPDTDGVPQNDTRTYTFTATQPGTYLYEAGPTENARHQVAMGLYGAFVVRPPGAAAARLTTVIGGNADLTFTAVASGAGGNAITVEYVDPGAANSPLAVSVSGSAISVQLATDGGSVITSTASQVMAAVNANAAAAALVAVTLATGSDGTGIVAPLAPTALVGGQSSAYGPSSVFDDEAVLVLGEIDPVLNSSADPSTFDMKRFSPTYRVINGRTYHDGGTIPSTDAIQGLPGDRVLLRYVNAGVDEHSMGVLGMHQTVLAVDGHPYTYTYRAVAETIGAGSTMDTVVTLPADTGASSSFPLFDQGQHIDLAGAGWATSPTGQVTAGGMMTFIQTPNATDPCAGPVATGGSASPQATTGATPVSVTASFTACAPAGGSQKSVNAAEYFLDTIGANGSGTALTVGSPAGTVTVGPFTIDAASLPVGLHTVFIHARDSADLWGGFDAEAFYVDRVGPDSVGLSLDPEHTNGTSSVALTGTADDVLNGNQNVTDAEFRIDSQAAAPTAMSVTPPPAAIAEITATIPQASVNGLTQGAHTIFVRSRDAFGNWGAYSSVTLTVDRTGPDGSNAEIGPSPNNGSVSIDPNSFELQASADFTDPTAGGVNSDITRAEGFLGTTGAAGSGVVFLPTDGAFDSASENGYIRFPLAQINGLSQGPHLFFMHARDAAGNWGPFTSATLIVDKTGPAVTGLAVSAGTLTGSAVDPTVPGTSGGSSIQAAEWFQGTDPGAGNGNPVAAADGTYSSASEALTASMAGLSPGSHTVFVRAQDVAGNWGPTASVTFTVGSSVLFANSFASGNLSGWSSATGGSAIAATTAAKLNGADAYGMQVTLNGKATRFVEDTTPNKEAAYSVRFYLNPHGSQTGTATPTIFAGSSSGGGVLLRVQFQRSGSSYRVRAAAKVTGGFKTTPWVAISNAAHAIEVDWVAGSAGTLRLATDGVVRQTLSNLANSKLRIDTARLGPSATLARTLTGTVYFDGFVSTRGGTVGP